jgi:cytosine/uracil/thiamine/allantoin permease
MRKQNLDMKRLYTRGQGGYWYNGGVRYSGIIALFGAIVLNYVLAYALPNVVGIGVTTTKFYSLSFATPGQLAWYTGVILGFVLMLGLNAVTKEK